MNNFDYKNMTPFKWFVLENFPFIENNFEEINNYRLFSKVVEYLNKMKDNVNLTGQQMENVTNAMIELQNYVNNYFDNLDVQEEINNKLDEMVEQGTLQEIIGDYLNSKAIFGFDTVQDMKQATNLINGSYARTLGYYQANDGGASLYKIRERTFNDNVDESFIILMNDENLVAELIVEKNELSIKQLGGKSEQDTNYNHFDNKNILLNFIAKITNIFNPKLIIPNGIFCFSPTHIKTEFGIHIEGKNINSGNNRNNTIICAIVNNSNYIWKLGGNSDNTEPNDLDITKNYSLKNLTFSSHLINLETSNDLLHVEKALDLDCIGFSEFQNLSFYYIDGTGFSIKSCWELDINNLYFTALANFDYPKFLIDSCWTNFFNGDADTSAINIGYLYFEAINGNAIKISNTARFSHSHINNINIEGRFFSEYGTTIGVYSNSVTNPVELALIDIGQMNNTSINNIELSNFTTYATNNNINYIITKLFENQNSSMVDIIVNNITLAIFNHKFYLAKLNNKNIRSSMIINNYTQYNELMFNNGTILDVISFPKIFINNALDTYYANLLKNQYQNISDYVYRCSRDNVKQFITTQNDSLNRFKICVGNNGKIPKSTNPVIFSFQKIYSDLHLHAKIPDGKTCRLYCKGKNQYGSTYEPVFDLVGTGAWKWYSLNTLNNQFSGFGEGTNVLVVEYTDYLENEEVAQFDVFYGS